MEHLDAKRLEGKNYDKAYSDLKHAIESLPPLEENQNNKETALKPDQS